MAVALLMAESGGGLSVGVKVTTWSHGQDSDDGDRPVRRTVSVHQAKARLTAAGGQVKADLAAVLEYLKTQALSHLGAQPGVEVQVAHDLSNCASKGRVDGQQLGHVEVLDLVENLDRVGHGLPLGQVGRELREPQFADEVRA
jgi:hypothetical protein